MKRKLWIFTFFFLILFPFVSADSIGSTTSTGYATQFIRNGHTITDLAVQTNGQEFTFAGAGTAYLESVTFRPVGLLTASYVVRASIYSDSGDVPTTLLIFNESTLDLIIYTSYGSATDVKFNFSNYPLTRGTKYWVVFTHNVTNINVNTNTDTTYFEPQEYKGEGGASWVAEASKRLAINISFNNGTISVIPTITFQGQTPANKTAKHTSQNSFSVNTTTADLGGSIDTSHYIFNNTGSLIQQNNETGGDGLYISTFSGLNVGTYLYNATATNSTNSTSSETRTIYVYEVVAGSITLPANNSANTGQYQNITWNNATINPSASPVKITGFIVALLNGSGVYNQTLTGTGNLSYYWDIYATANKGAYQIEIASIDNQTFNATANINYNVSYDSNLNLSVKNALTSILLSSGNVQIVETNTSTTRTFNTTTGQFLIPIIRGYSYAISADFAGYAPANATYQANSSILQFYNLSLYDENSVYITILNEANLALLTGVDINVSFIGLTTYYFNTTNGTLFVSNLTPDYYEVAFSANGYSPKSYFLTINNHTTQTLTALLTATFSGIGVYLKNAGDEPIIGGLITIQRYVNSTYITIAQGQTDGIGYNLFQLENGINYLWTITSAGYLPKQFLLKPYDANQPYIFKMTNNVSSNSISFNNFVSYYFTPTNKTLMNGSTTFSFTTLTRNNSFGSNSILWTSMNCNGSTTNVSGSPSGATIIQTINLSNNAGQRVTCIYGLQVDAYPAFYFQNVYVVLGYTIGNNSIVSASEEFKDDTPEAWQAIFVMFIIACVVMITFEFSKESRDVNLVVSVAGFGCLTIFAFLGWVSLPMTALLVIEAGLIYYANRGGY